MSRKIPLSFKDTTRDSWLYDVINKQGDKSNFIKDAVEFYLNQNEMKKFKKARLIEEDKDSIFDI